MSANERPDPPTVRAAVRPAPETPTGVAAELGTIHLDAGLRIVEANDAFCEQISLTRAEARGEPLSRYFHPTARENLQEHLWQLLDGRHGDFSVPATLLGADGEENDCLVTAISVNTVPFVSCAGCARWAALVLVIPNTEQSTPLALAPAPVALAEVPAHVLEGVAYGLSTQQLASRLGLSSHGIEYHISVMMRKLKAPNRSALVARAYALNILTTGCWPPRVNPQYATRSTVGASSHPPPETASGLRQSPSSADGIKNRQRK